MSLSLHFWGYLTIPSPFSVSSPLSHLPIEVLQDTHMLKDSPSLKVASLLSLTSSPKTVTMKCLSWVTSHKSSVLSPRFGNRSLESGTHKVVLALTSPGGECFLRKSPVWCLLEALTLPFLIFQGLHSSLADTFSQRVFTISSLSAWLSLCLSFPFLQRKKNHLS